MMNRFPKVFLLPAEQGRGEPQVGQVQSYTGSIKKKRERESNSGLIIVQSFIADF